MMGAWSHLRRFVPTKFIMVVDADADVRSRPDVVWVIAIRMDPARGTLCGAPTDYLGFASPVRGPGVWLAGGARPEVLAWQMSVFCLRSRPIDPLRTTLTWLGRRGRCLCSPALHQMFLL